MSKNRPRSGIHAMEPLERTPETDTGTTTTWRDLRVGKLVRVLARGKWRPAKILRVDRVKGIATVRIVANKRGVEIVRREPFRWIMLP